MHFKNTMIIYINYFYVVKIGHSEANTKYLGISKTYFFESLSSQISITYKLLLLKYVDGPLRPLIIVLTHV